MNNRSQEWIDQTSLKIRDVFDLFDKDHTDSIVQEEVGAIMRSLGAYPPEKVLVLEILPELQEDDNPGLVSFRKFKKKMLQILAEKLYQPDVRDILLQAFRTIDTENKGYIAADVMETYLTSYGTVFRSTELESFLLAAKDPDTGNIHYEDYCALFSKDIV